LDLSRARVEDANLVLFVRQPFFQASGGRRVRDDEGIDLQVHAELLCDGIEEECCIAHRIHQEKPHEHFLTQQYTVLKCEESWLKNVPRALYVHYKEACQECIENEHKERDLSMTDLIVFVV